MRLLALIAAVLCAALLATGCGGGAGGSSAPAPPAGGAAKEGGAPGTEAGGAAGGATKPANEPNGPAGSKVVSCKVGAADMAQLRATVVDCGAARAAMRRWAGDRACAPGAGASRSACSLSGFRCQAVRTDRGAVVSCARPGAAVSFIAKSPPLKSGPG